MLLARIEYHIKNAATTSDVEVPIKTGVKSIFELAMPSAWIIVTITPSSDARGGIVTGCVFLMELSFLKGRSKLKDYPVRALVEFS